VILQYFSILVVDDEEKLKNASSTILSNMGYDITSTASAKEALYIVDSQVFDLILSDVVMPEMDRHDLVELVKKNSRLFVFS
tara:strand:+ start:694 stop:939 length:246 start_codon:yes stop_codon:yes gene_type:complete